MSRSSIQIPTPHWITARFASKCSSAGCPAAIEPGDKVFYLPSRGGSVTLRYGDKCGHAAPAEADWLAAEKAIGDEIIRRQRQ